MFTLKKLTKIYNKSSRWTQLLLWIFILFIIAVLVNKYKPIKEGFIQNKKYILKKDSNIFDEFYVDIYDDLVYSKVKNDFEIGEIINTTSPTEQSILLDIGSGTGHHVDRFNQRGIQSIGIDIAPSMVKKAQDKFPELEFKVGNALDSMIFAPNSFTHITCLFFTLYYIKDKMEFFQNCFDWLMPGGYLIIHLVNRNRFDPILPAADPLMLVSPQKFAKKRITNSLVKFNNFQYKANFELFKNKNKATFTETFKDDATSNVRQNIHTFYIPTQKYILSLAKDVGFILLGKIDMISVQYEYQYLYILQKPE